MRQLVSRFGSSMAVCGRLAAPGARRRPRKYARYEPGRRRTPGTTMHPAACGRTYESRHETLWKRSTPALPSTSPRMRPPGPGRRRPACDMDHALDAAARRRTHRQRRRLTAGWTTAAGVASVAKKVARKSCRARPTRRIRGLAPLTFGPETEGQEGENPSVHRGSTARPRGFEPLTFGSVGGASILADIPFLPRNTCKLGYSLGGHERTREATWGHDLFPPGSHPNALKRPDGYRCVGARK